MSEVREHEFITLRRMDQNDLAHFQRLTDCKAKNDCVVNDDDSVNKNRHRNKQGGINKQQVVTGSGYVLILKTTQYADRRNFLYEKQ